MTNTKHSRYRRLPDGITLHYSFLNAEVTKLVHEYNWGTFTINGNVLSRTGCFQGNTNSDGYFPWLRCPSNENQTILKVTPTTELLREMIKTRFGFNTNIFKIQMYNTGNVGIASHSDKIVDLEKDTPIFIIRWGATRTMVLANKDTGEELNLEMPHGSLLLIPYTANLRWKHGILKDPSVQDTSISIVARNSITFARNDSDFVVSENEQPIISKKQQMDEMVKLFRLENNNITNPEMYNECKWNWK